MICGKKMGNSPDEGNTEKINPGVWEALWGTGEKKGLR